MSKKKGEYLNLRCFIAKCEPSSEPSAGHSRNILLYYKNIIIMKKQNIASIAKVGHRDSTD